MHLAYYARASHQVQRGGCQFSPRRLPLVQGVKLFFALIHVEWDAAVCARCLSTTKLLLHCHHLSFTWQRHRALSQSSCADTRTSFSDFHLFYPIEKYSSQGFLRLDASRETSGVRPYRVYVTAPTNANSHSSRDKTGETKFLLHEEETALTDTDSHGTI
jgi:hypothetical protein